MSKIGRVNFIHGLFCPFSTHDDVVMQVLVWLHMVRFQRSDLAWLGPVGHFIHEFEMTSHIVATDLKKNPLISCE